MKKKKIISVFLVLTVLILSTMTLLALADNPSASAGDVRIDEISLTESNGADGTSNVLSDDTAQLTAEFSLQASWIKYAISIKNHGSSAVKLLRCYSDDIIDGISINLPDNTSNLLLDSEKTGVFSVVIKADSTGKALKIGGTYVIHFIFAGEDNTTTTTIAPTTTNTTTATVATTTMSTATTTVVPTAMTTAVAETTATSINTTTEYLTNESGPHFGQGQITSANEDLSDKVSNSQSTSDIDDEKSSNIKDDGNEQSSNSSDQNDSSPDTGIDNSIYIYVMLVTISTLTLIITRRKRTKSVG